MAQLPIGSFLEERLTEFDSSFELRKGTGFEQLFFKPLEFIVQPLRDELNEIFTGQSFKRILETDDPDAFDEEVVDSLASNLFVNRREGGQSGGVAKSFFNEPVDREFPTGGAVFTAGNGEQFTNGGPFKITATQMSLQIEEGLYFFEIPVDSINTGDAVNIDPNELVELVGDPDVVRVTNELEFKGGIPRELNIDFIDRVKESIAVRDLLIGKGFNAILFENFSNVIQELQPIGFGDIEMMRDIVFNTHIGGKVDGYTKTFSITEGTEDFVGLLIDPTRQVFTSINVQLFGVAFASLGEPNVDRSNGKLPVVQEIKTSFPAEYLSPVDLSSPIDLSVAQHIKIGINGEFKNIRIAGAVPGATTRNEIVNLINNSFDQDVAFPEGNSFKLKSPGVGLDQQIVIDNPDIGTTTILIVFGLASGAAPHIFDGDGPVTFLEGVHYEIDDPFGRIKRIVGPTIEGPNSTGETTATSDVFNDATLNIFLNVAERDIITITSGSEPADYRVLEKIDNNNLRVDFEFSNTEATLDYEIKRTGIKNEEIVFVTYYFNPLSIDIGKNIVLDEFGRERGIRPGRENQTITDGPVLRIKQIEIIDPLTREPTGTILDGTGGYGQGGYGQGGYGIGEGEDYRIVVNKPTERFSMFDDSLIVINSGFSALSFRVTYDFVPEIEDIHDFVRSENERIMGGDILQKHFLPSFVSGTIEYSVDETDSSVPTNDAVQTEVRNFVNALKSGENLEYSDLKQVIHRVTDPFDKFGTFIKNFKLESTIHNTDGTETRITGENELIIPTLDPFPIETDRPLSPRIAGWIADIDLVLTRFTE